MSGNTQRWEDGIEPLLDTRRLSRPSGYAVLDPTTGSMREFKTREIRNEPLIQRLMSKLKIPKRRRAA